MRGMDALQAAQEASGDAWMKLFNPKLYEGDSTWESRNPISLGIARTITGFVVNFASHYARMIQKRTGERKTMQFSQLGRDQASIELTFFHRGREEFTEERWNEIKSRAIQYLERMLVNLKAGKGEGGAHWQSRVRTVSDALEIVQRQMIYPWTWRDFSEVLREIPRLAPLAEKRGGALQTIINLATDAKSFALGELSRQRIAAGA